jgi:AcrR family transcriptional regulator
MTRNHDEIRDKIVGSARSYFARFGLFKTTIDDISHSLRMGKSSLYYYFKNKEEIFEAVIKKELEILSLQVREAVDRAATPQDKLMAYAVTRMTCLRELANVYSALRDEYLNSFGFVQKIRKDFDSGELNLVMQILRDGVDRGTFAITDVELTAQVIIVALRGFEFEWSVKGKDIDINADVAKLHSILLNGIMKK